MGIWWRPEISNLRRLPTVRVLLVAPPRVSYLKLLELLGIPLLLHLQLPLQLLNIGLVPRR